MTNAANGANYIVGDVVSLDPSSVGGTGSGITAIISAIQTEGLEIFDNTLHTKMYHNGTRWVQSGPIYMTTAARTAYTPWVGMRVYDIDLNKEYVWDNAIWQATW
jgi:hypothetical protein